MGEVKLKEKKAKGFAGLIEAVLSPLNNTKKFKEKFVTTNVKVLLNAINLDHAALIILENGTLRVEGVENKPKENLKKKKIGWNALLEMDSQIFFAIAMNRLSMPGVIKNWLRGKIKMKGIRKLLILLKVFSLLNEDNN